MLDAAARHVPLLFVIIAAAATGLFSQSSMPQTALAQAVVYAVSGIGTSSGPSDLYTIIPAASGTDTPIGRLTAPTAPTAPVITDIALAPAGPLLGGKLFGASFDTLYSIDKDTAVATPITTVVYFGTAESGTINSITDIHANWTYNQFTNYKVVITEGKGVGQNRNIFSNTKDTLSVMPGWADIPDATSVFEIRTGLGGHLHALTFSASGHLYGATGQYLISFNLAQAYLMRINTSTGQATNVGTLGPGLTSVGDMAFSPKEGILYGTASDYNRNEQDVLVTIELLTGAATRVHAKNIIGFDNVLGLFFDGPDLYGLTAETQRCDRDGALIKINRSTGKGAFMRCLSFQALGATT